MPAAERGHSPRLMERLRKEPYRFEFFQAVRVLGVHFRKRLPKGEAQDRAIRFGNSLSLSFPPSEIESVDFTDAPTHEGAAPGEASIESVRLVPTFIGLTGNQGTLPRHYTETLAERELVKRDRTSRAFLDIFTDRAVMQFYRAWLKYRLHFQYEYDRKNRYLPLLMSLTGLGPQALHGRLADGERGVLDESLAYYAGVLRMAGKSAATVERLLADYLRMPVKLEQFVGRWFDVPASQNTALGGRQGALGAGALCGGRVWQRENRVRIEIGPLTKPEFNDLLPGGAAAASLAKLLGLMTGIALEYEIQLLLREDQVQAAGLHDDESARLGLDGWLLTETPTAPLRDACFEIQPHLH